LTIASELSAHPRLDCGKSNDEPRVTTVAMSKKKPIETAGAPAAAGPYSQGVRFGDLVFVAGQRPADPVSGEIPADLAAQTRRVLDNLKAVLEAGGSSLDQVLKVSVYLTDLGDFAAMNEIYKEYFSEPHPARTTIGCVLRGIKIEVDAIGYRKD